MNLSSPFIEPLRTFFLYTFIPLYKNGAECDPCNYRPISVLPVLSKVIKRHVHNTLCTFPELKLLLNISANERCHWAESYKLSINESKSKVLAITGKCLASKINDEFVLTVEENKKTLLGLTIDGSLSFDCHVENLCNKLASCIGVLSKIRNFLLLK